MGRAVARIPVRGCTAAYLVLFDVQDQVPRSGSGGLAGGAGLGFSYPWPYKAMRALQFVMLFDALWKVQLARNLGATNSKLAGPFGHEMC